MEDGGCLVVLSLAYSLQDERDGNQSGALALGGCEPALDGEGILARLTGFPGSIGVYGRMVERNGGKVENDGLEHQERRNQPDGPGVGRTQGDQSGCCSDPSRSGEAGTGEGVQERESFRVAQTNHSYNRADDER